MATALVVAGSIHLKETITGVSLFSGSATVIFAKTAIWTTGLTTLVWIIVTLATAPESNQVLASFYRKVRPDVRGWRPVAAATPEIVPTRDLGRNLIAWLLGCGMVYGALFGVGKLLLLRPGVGIVLLLVSAVCALLLYRDISRRRWSEGEAEVQPAPKITVRV
jgi:hypothetical protein